MWFNVLVVLINISLALLYLPLEFSSLFRRWLPMANNQASLLVQKQLKDLCKRHVDGFSAGLSNCNEKSTEGLSIAFLTTWMIGYIFNLLGCLIEPATLPTQFYMALLYTVTTAVLYVQSIYYGHIYPRLKNRRNQMVEAERISNISSDLKIPGRWRNSSNATPCGGQTTPITMIPGSHRNSFTGRD